MSYISLGVSDILEIPVQNSDTKIELAINSVLAFTNKCICDNFKSEKIVKMLIGFYNEMELKQAYEFCRSLLEKKDRPKRDNVNYNTFEKTNTINMSKQIISMVKLVIKNKNIMLASRNLNVPLVYTNTNDIIDHCGATNNMSMTSEKKSSHLLQINELSISGVNEQTNYINSDCSLTCESQKNCGQLNIISNNKCTKPDAAPTAAAAALVDGASTGVECTLQAILAELKIVNKNTSQINVLATTMQKFIQEEKQVNGVNQNNSFNCEASDIDIISNSSLNWTFEQNKWMTPSNKISRQANVQTFNLLHSTPVLRDPVIQDLQDIFDNISTTTNENKPQDISLPLNISTKDNLPKQNPQIPMVSTQKPVETTILPQEKKKSTRINSQVSMPDYEPYLAVILTVLASSNIFAQDVNKGEVNMVMAEFPVDDVLDSAKIKNPNDTKNITSIKSVQKDIKNLTFNIYETSEKNKC